jgi:hypothetical protein
MLFLSARQEPISKREAPAAPSVRRVVVWLDNLAPHQGAFDHSLEWSRMLRLPLHGIVPASLGRAGIGDEALAACAATCAREGVAWSYGWESSIIERSQLLENDFCVVGHALMRSPGKRFLRALLHSQVGLLVCPPAWRSFRRALVVHADPALNRHYLDIAATTCHRAGCAASVLTVAHSEAAARRMQDLAMEAFTRQSVAADFHTVVGNDAHVAVPMVAGWRRCSHILVEQTRPKGWRRWLGFDLDKMIWEFADRFAILAVPAGPSPLTDRMLTISATRRETDS